MLARLVRFGPRSTDWRRVVPLRGQHAYLSFVAPQVSLRRLTSTCGSARHCCAASVTRLDERDTIAALSSGSGRCGVALLRVSGPQAG